MGVRSTLQQILTPASVKHHSINQKSAITSIGKTQSEFLNTSYIIEGNYTHCCKYLNKQGTDYPSMPNWSKTNLSNIIIQGSHV